MSKKRSTIKLLIVIALIIAAIVGLVMFTPTLVQSVGHILWLFMPFIAAYLLSLLVNPLADGLEKRFRLPRGVAAVIVVILTVGVVGGIITAVVWKIVDEVKGFYNDFPVIYANIRLTWYTISDSLSHILNALPENFREIVDSFSEQTMDWLADFAKNTEIVRSAGNAAKKVPSVFISIIVFILSLYFMVSDSKTVALAVKKPFTPTFLNRISQLRYEIKKYVGGYVKAQLLIMCIAFVILLTGFSLVGVDYALIIAILTAVMDALPFFGSGLVLIPWAIISFITGNIPAGVGFLIIYLSVIFTRQMVEPKIVSKNIGMHPIITLMSMYVGYRVFSLGGMIVGPLVAMLVVSLYKVGLFDDIIKMLKTAFLKLKKEAIIIKKSLENEGE